jgi:hypothetical protein
MKINAEWRSTQTDTVAAMRTQGYAKKFDFFGFKPLESEIEKG